jgi:hypothetical protein
LTAARKAALSEYLAIGPEIRYLEHPFATASISSTLTLTISSSAEQKWLRHTPGRSFAMRKFFGGELKAGRGTLTEKEYAKGHQDLPLAEVFPCAPLRATSSANNFAHIMPFSNALPERVFKDLGR